MFKLMDKKILAFLRLIYLINWPYEFNLLSLLKYIFIRIEKKRNKGVALEALKHIFWTKSLYNNGSDIPLSR